jgi:hypothetical protein
MWITGFTIHGLTGIQQCAVSTTNLKLSMSPATSLLQILNPTRNLIVTAHNQQVVNVRAAVMDMGTATDEAEEAEKAKRRERQVQMHTKKCPNRNPRMDHQKPSHRIMGAADHRIRRMKKDAHGL